MTNSVQQTHIQYAGFWRRLMALFLDTTLFTILSAPLMYLLIGHEYFFWLAGNDARLSEATDFFLFLHSIVFIILIFGFWNLMSSTPGKMLMGCQIVDAKTLQPMSHKQALIRLGGYFVSALPFYLGFVWAAYDKKKQGLHDKLAKTLVLYHSDDYANQSLEDLQSEFFNKAGKVG